MSPSERAAVEQAHRQFGEPTATPKPRAGEHVSEDLSVTITTVTRLAMERDLLRERERELVEVLEVILRAEFGPGMFLPAGCESTYWGKARTLLTKHGR